MKRINFIGVDIGLAQPFRAGFVAVYKEAFAGPPYFEDYTDEQVIRDVWEPHLKSGHISLALDVNNQVIGLSCCLALTAMTDEQDHQVKKFLAAQPGLPLVIAETCYISELAVLTKYRRQGIGTELSKNNLAWAKSQSLKTYLLRTAAEGSNSRSLFQALGAVPLTSVSQTISEQEIVSASGERIFLFGQIG